MSLGFPLVPAGSSSVGERELPQTGLPGTFRWRKEASRPQGQGTLSGLGTCGSIPCARPPGHPMSLTGEGNLMPSREWEYSPMPHDILINNRPHLPQRYTPCSLAPSRLHTQVCESVLCDVHTYCQWRSWSSPSSQSHQIHLALFAGLSFNLRGEMSLFSTPSVARLRARAWVTFCFWVGVVGNPVIMLFLHCCGP